MVFKFSSELVQIHTWILQNPHDDLSKSTRGFCKPLTLCVEMDTFFSRCRGVSYRGLFKNFLCPAPDVLTLMYMLPSGREVLMPLRV